MTRSETIWGMKGPLLALTWMDKKAVHAAGTNAKVPGHDTPTANRKKTDGTIKQVTYLQLIAEYNNYMGGVDCDDQMHSY